MSIDCMSWVWKNSPAKGSELLLLLALADFADDTGVSWPSQDLLAGKVRLSRQATVAIIARLERNGCIKVTKRAGGTGGGSRSSVYRVLMSESKETLLSRGSESKDRGGARVNSGVQDSSREPSERDDPLSPIATTAQTGLDINVPVIRKRTGAHVVLEDEVANIVGTIWKYWPRKEGKQRAKDVVARLMKRGLTGNHIVPRATEYYVTNWHERLQSDPEAARYCPYLASWLNSEEWTP